MCVLCCVVLRVSCFVWVFPRDFFLRVFLWVFSLGDAGHIPLNRVLFFAFGPSSIMLVWWLNVSCVDVCVWSAGMLVQCVLFLVVSY